MDDEIDRAEFQLFALQPDGTEEMVAGSDGPRELALAEIVHYWHQCNGMGERRVYEVVRIPVDMSPLERPSTSGLIITLERRQ